LDSFFEIYHRKGFFCDLRMPRMTLNIWRPDPRSWSFHAFATRIIYAHCIEIRSFVCKILC